MEKLKALNGFTYNDLIFSRQRRFKRKTLRTIELTEKVDVEIKRELFERINTGNDILRDMEVRKGGGLAIIHYKSITCDLTLTYSYFFKNHKYFVTTQPLYFSTTD